MENKKRLSRKEFSHRIMIYIILHSFIFFPIRTLAMKLSLLVSVNVSVGVWRHEWDMLNVIRYLIHYRLFVKAPETYGLIILLHLKRKRRKPDH